MNFSIGKQSKRIDKYYTYYFQNERHAHDVEIDDDGDFNWIITKVISIYITHAQSTFQT